MKKLNLIIIMFVTIFFAACEADKDIVMVKSSLSPNDLGNLTAATFVLNRDNATNEFQKFTWSDIDYGFATVVNYTLQFDKKASNFSAPTTLISVTNALEASVTTGEMNRLLLAAGLDPDVAADIQFRVKATIHPSVAPVYSDVVEAKITPYATTFPPIYMTGAATGGWGWDPYVYKELRSIAPNVYETVGYFLNGEAFRFFKQVGWGPDSWNYPYFTGTVSNLFENAADGDLDFRFVGTTGYFKITVNMTTKSVAMEAVATPVLYATGEALGGWDWTTNFIQLTWKANGIFQATTDFVAGSFRFFKDAGWVDGYNYPYFNGGTVSPLFENAADGDSNFRFIGTPGSYTVTVNLIDKTVTMTQP